MPRIGKENRSCHLELWAGLLGREGAVDKHTSVFKTPLTK